MYTGFRKAIPSDISAIAPRLRLADLNELQASTGEHPVLALRKSFALSEECYTIIAKGEIAGMFGLVEGGVVWLVGSNALTSITVRFLRDSRHVVASWLRREPRLWNFLDERNEVHIKWIEWLGFAPTGRSCVLLDPSVKFLEYSKCASPS